MRCWRSIRSRLASEQGFGLIEVLTAAILLSVGLVGALTAFDAASEASFTAQRHEQVISLAQAEVERLEAVPFGQLALNAHPTWVDDPAPDNPSDPRAFVSGTDFMILENYHDADAPGGVVTAPEPMVVDSASGIAPVEAGVSIGPSSPNGAQPAATVYRFVTRREEGCLASASGTVCPDTNRSKRITVAVLPDEVGNGAGPHKPVYVSSVVTAPEPTPAP